MRSIRLLLLAGLAVTGSASAATFTVTNANDSGPGSLRAAIIAANANADLDTIEFAVGTQPITINLLTPLPEVTAPVRIDGWTQPGTRPSVRISGASVGSNSAPLLGLFASACTQANCFVRGLMLVEGKAAGLRISGGGWTVQGNFVGTNGIQAQPNAGNGLVVSTGGNLVGGTTSAQRNLIAGNGGIGLTISGSNNVVTGNYIGTSQLGLAALPNGGGGISVIGGSSVRIGGTATNERNVIAGNGIRQIDIGGSVNGIEIIGNRIGIGADGVTALSPNGAGVVINGRSVQIAANVVSGNGQGGIAVMSGASDNVVISGNLVGLNAAGSAGVPNGGIGIRIAAGAGITVGGFAAGSGNRIAASQQYGVAVESGAIGVTVAGNSIGTDITGNVALQPNAIGVGLAGSEVSLVGNLISGNGQGGISVGGAQADMITIAGNRIGTNADGTAALANGGIGVRVTNGTNISIGGVTEAGRNVIAASQFSNLTLEGGVNGAEVVNNRIGTNLAGDAALSPNAAGVSIGGRNISFRDNVVSGHGNGGVAIDGDVDGVAITGNRIGTNAAGTQALANGSYGIRAISGRGVRIGGAGAGEGNLISGNARGVAIEQAMREVVLEGNTIGLDADRSARIPNGDWNGLDVAAPGTVVGGTTPGSGNVIAGNQGSGIFVQGEAASGSVIRGNFIGTNPAGVAGLGNDAAGIRVRRSHAVSIGGTVAGAGNLIAHNRFNGIIHQAGDGIAVQGNRIRDNDFLGIEVEPQGPSVNDPLDADGGANHGQNFPVITSALASGGQVTIGGFLDSEPQKDYLVEIVHNPVCDPSGLGEGATSLGFVPVTTDAAGRATFGAQLPLPSASGVVAALVTAPDGSTSEFSPCHALTGPNPGSFQFWRRPFLTWEGLPHLVVTVVRSGGNAGPASVRMFTQDDSATAPADYGAIDTRLEFADGEVLKTLLVPIVADNLQEGQEQFLVRLGSPLGGATLGPQATSEAIIIDVGPDFPMYFIDDVSVDEPSSGQATATFTVTMTPNTQPFTVQWSTSDGTAVAGSDYVAASGQLVFPPSAVPQSRTLVVPVLADADPEEGNEVFYVDLSATGNIAVFKGTGIGTIRQPSAPRPDALFSNGFE